MVAVEVLCQQETTKSCGGFIQAGEGFRLSGLIIGVEMSGHAGVASKGADPACAALSSSILAFSEAIAKNQDVVSVVDSSGRGNLKIRVTGYSPLMRGWLAGLGCGLTHSLSRIIKEYPEAVKVTVLTEVI